MKALLGGVIAVCVALIVFGYVLAIHTNSGSGPRLLPENPAYAQRVTDGGWTKGDLNAPVKLVEYGDFQCPACYAMYPIINDALAQEGTKVLFTFRNYPLSQLHNKAQIASMAAEAAGEQGKFWEMHDLLYSSQQSWETQLVSTFRDTTLPQFAQQIQLNVDQFKRDLSNSKLAQSIDTDRAAGDKIPLKGTPTLVLNGVSLDPLPSTKEGLVAAIEAAASAPAPIATPTP
jgi:protein-disulfide isomerase